MMSQQPTTDFDDAYATQWALSTDRVRKHIFVSETTIQFIDQFMEMNGLNRKRDFSKTLEFLALQSLQDGEMLGTLSVLKTVMERTITQQYNRFAKLVAHAAIEAGAAKEAAQQLLFIQLLHEQMAYEKLLADLDHDDPRLDEFEGMLSVDPQSEMGKVLITFFNRRKKRFRYRSVKALKAPLAEFEEIDALLKAWGMALDEREDGEQNE